MFSIDWNTVVRPSRVFRRVLPPAKRPRIEALKLQMCVMVISPLFAVILMTDLIPVFKRPTETQHRLDIGKHFENCELMFRLIFQPPQPRSSLIILITNSRPTELDWVLVQILRCKFFQSGFSTNSWALNAAASNIGKLKVVSVQQKLLRNQNGESQNNYFKVNLEESWIWSFGKICRLIHAHMNHCLLPKYELWKMYRMVYEFVEKICRGQGYELWFGSAIYELR